MVCLAAVASVTSDPWVLDTATAGAVGLLVGYLWGRTER